MMRRISLVLSAITVVMVVGHFAVTLANAQAPRDDSRGRFVTAQSELDYLAARHVPVTIELKRATSRQILNEVASMAAIHIAFEGKLDDLPLRDVSFKSVPLKQVLTELGTTLKISYRVDRADALTVVGTPA